MGYLYFEHKDGSLTLVAECTEDETHSYIRKYVEELNPNFVIYYIRMWGNADGGITYDVGSHTEFFHWYKEPRD